MFAVFSLYQIWALWNMRNSCPNVLVFHLFTVDVLSKIKSAPYQLYFISNEMMLYIWFCWNIRFHVIRVACSEAKQVEWDELHKIALSYDNMITVLNLSQWNSMKIAKRIKTALRCYSKSRRQRNLISMLPNNLSVLYVFYIPQARVST